MKLSLVVSPWSTWLMRYIISVLSQIPDLNLVPGRGVVFSCLFWKAFPTVAEPSYGLDVGASACSMVVCDELPLVFRHQHMRTYCLCYTAGEKATGFLHCRLHLSVLSSPGSTGFSLTCQLKSGTPAGVHGQPHCQLQDRVSASFRRVSKINNNNNKKPCVYNLWPRGWSWLSIGIVQERYNVTIYVI